jgi:hypothetical protein
LAGCAAGLAWLAWAAGAPAQTPVRFADVVDVAATELAPLAAVPIERLALFACAGPDCQPIPFQIDERDADGRWVLDHGPEPNLDAPAAVLDGNDRLLFMAQDAGGRALRADLPGSLPAVELTVYDPTTAKTRWTYLVAFSGRAPRSPLSYVRYDPSSDSVSGARVTLGFRRGLPSLLRIASADDGDNLLDRFKVRATAWFLWGLLRFSRSEDDVTTQFVGWREGPIRVIRAQRQWVRIGWGIRSPTFGSYTYFYRDFAELPVGLHLNFKPTYFFTDIDVRVVLDFRDLRGWGVLVPGRRGLVRIDGSMNAAKTEINSQTEPWFALLGPQLTLVQRLDLSPSLEKVRLRLFYAEGSRPRDPPEDVAGQLPGIGYRLDRWDDVGAGSHSLRSTSFALPADVDVRAFVASRDQPLRADARIE